MAWMRSDLGALRDERSTVTMFYRFRLPPLSDTAARDAAKLIRVAEQSIPAGGGSLFGSWCLADSELAFMLHRLILDRRGRAGAGPRLRRSAVGAPVGARVHEHARPATVPDGYWAFSGTPQPAPPE